MFKTKNVCCLLQVFGVLNIITPNKGEILGMNWETKPDQEIETITVRTQRLIHGLGAFNYLGNQNSTAFTMQEFVRSTLEPPFILFIFGILQIGRYKMGTLFYAAVSLDKDKNRVYLNWIGQISNVGDIFSSEHQMTVKYSAELYAQSHYAFQSIWQLPETYKQNSGNLCNAASNQMHFPTKHGDALTLTLTRYWIVTPNQEMVVLYANQEGTVGAYATIATCSTSNSPDPKIIKLEFTETSFAEIFDDLWKHLDAGLAFESGWDLIGKTDPVLKNFKCDFPSHAPWLQENSVVVMFAETAKWNGLICRLFKTSGSYGANTLFAVWNVKTKYIVHVSHPGTLKQTVASLRTYCMTGLWKNVNMFIYGVGFVEKDHFCNKYLPEIKTAFEKSRYSIRDCTISVSGVLANFAHIDYTSTQNIYVVIENQNEKYFSALIELQIHEQDGNTKVTVQSILMDEDGCRPVLFLVETVKMGPAEVVPLIETTKCSSDPLTLDFSFTAWNLGSPDSVDIDLSTVEKFLNLKANIERIKILYSHESYGKMLVIINLFRTNEFNIEHEYVCFVALKKVDNGFKVTWAGTEYYAVSLGVRESKSEAESYHSNATFAYEENWELTARNSETAGKQSNDQEHCYWELPDKRHKIQIFREMDEGDSMFWYVPMVKPEESSTYMQGFPGRKCRGFGTVLRELATNLDNPLLFSKRFYKKDMEKFPEIKVQEIIDRIATKYPDSGEYFFETIVSTMDDLTKTVLVFNQAQNTKIRSELVDTAYVQYSTASTDARILVPLSRMNGTAVGLTFQRQGEMVEIKGGWQDSIGIQLLDPLSFAPAIKWAKSRQQLDNEALKYILYNAPWKSNASKFIIEKSKMIDWIPDHSDWIGNAFYICSLDEKDIKKKFLVIWNDNGEHLNNKLRYVGGLGDVQEVQKDYTRYISSRLVFQETGFMRGIARYDQTLEPVKKFLGIIHDFLGKEYSEKLPEVNFEEYLESYKFGRISTPLSVYEDDVQIYCLYGNGNPSNTPTVYATILINVKETMHGAKCLSFRTETTTPRSNLQAQNDLSKFVAQFHMRRSP